MSRINRTRGKVGEHEVKDVLNRVFKDYGLDDIEAKRIITETREGSFDVEIIHSGKRLPYVVQVKNVSSQFGAYLLKAWREARAYDEILVPVGVTKVPSDPSYRRRDTWLASIELERLAELLAKERVYDVMIGEVQER